jgi:hypothetical protein
MAPNINSGEKVIGLVGYHAMPVDSNSQQKSFSYRDVCRSLDRALEISESPDFKAMTEDVCKDYAASRFQEFLGKGVSHYIKNNPFQPVRDFFNDYMKEFGAESIRKKHPLLDAYYSLVGALEICRKKDFDEDHLEECYEEMTFLFGQFLKQGARAFLYETYVPPEELASRGYLFYHCSGGPIRDNLLINFYNKVLDPLMEDEFKRMEKDSFVRSNWMVLYYPSNRKERAEQKVLEKRLKELKGTDVKRTNISLIQRVAGFLKGG